MRVNAMNQDLRLLEIAQNGRVNPQNNQNQRVDSFKDAFSKEMASAEKINFSKHARQRLFSRGINLNEAKLQQLSEAIDKAEMKGSRDTLILDSEAAYVVSVTNRTVITAFDRATLQEGVFTSIDSAVIL